MFSSTCGKSTSNRFTELTLVLFVFLSEYDLYQTVVVFVSRLIYHFSYMLSMLETVFSLASFKSISFFFFFYCSLCARVLYVPLVSLLTS